VPAEAADAKGRLDRIEAAREGFLDLGREYWAAFALDDEVDNIPALRLIEEMAEQLREDRRRADRVEAHGGWDGG
jgi:hypothetical protein